jgi:hypothetical protein
MSLNYDRILMALENPTQRERGGPETIEEAVFRALGAASTCWEDLSGTGIFDSDRAKAIGDGLLAFIDARFTTKADA